MQRGYKLLIFGAAIFVLGVILIGITFVTLKQQSFSINSSIDTLSPHKSILKTIEVNAGKELGISLSYQPSDVLLNIQVIQQSNLSTVLDLNFTNKLFTTLIPSKDDIEKVMITNLGSKTISANTLLGNIEFFDTNDQPTVSISIMTMAIAGPSLLFIGVLVLIVSGILLLIDRIRRRKSREKEKK